MNRLQRPATFLLLCLIHPWTICGAASPWPQPVGRSTSDRDADLLDALVKAGRFEDALAICASHLRGVDAESDGSAKWTIHQSRILAARQMGNDRFEDADVLAAQKPTADLLNSYPQHRRRLFLEAQNIAVEHQAALHSVLRAAVSPTSDAGRDIALKRLLRATTGILSLSDRVGDIRSQLESERDAGDLALVADLVRLQQELQVDAVSLALLQTELFPRGSDDCIAAATKAEQAADDAMGKLPSDTAARREVERLRIEAIFRAGQRQHAEAELAELMRAFSQPTPPRIQAMQVRFDVASGRMERAGAQLAAYYGDSPERAPRSVEMDLARLEFLLHSDQGRGVGAWLDLIERREGSYARRRAESLSLANLRTSVAPQQVTAVDSSLVAAQGQDWLRRGDPGRGGELLSAAAASESDPDRAIQRAGEAAAALVAANRTPEAAQVLADVSLAKPSGTGASAAHLQSAVMIASGDGDDILQRLEIMLRTNLEQWPSGETATASRNWLGKLLSSQRRYSEAAEIATSVPVDEITAAEIPSIIDLWRKAFRSSRSDSLTDLSRRLEASFRPLLSSEMVRSQYRLAAALLLDRDVLSGLPEAAGRDAQVTFADALLDFRQRSVISDILLTPPQQYIDDAVWRLMRDGRTYPQQRASIARLLEQWEGHDDDSLDHAERLLWTGQIEKSVAMMRRLIRDTPDSAETSRRAAELLAASGDPQSRREAITLWDELASGSRQGSRMWHEAKLAAIGLLRQDGNKNEAQLRAKYILLTMPNVEPAIKAQYQSFLP